MFLDEYSIFENFDLLLTTDAGNSAALVLLDLTAAFDMINHSTLIASWALNGDWFKLYLIGESFSVQIGETSSVGLLSCGAPQGSILVQLLFSLYMLPLGSIFKKHN